MTSSELIMQAVGWLTAALAVGRVTWLAVRPAQPARGSGVVPRPGFHSPTATLGDSSNTG